MKNIALIFAISLSLAAHAQDKGASLEVDVIKEKVSVPVLKRLSIYSTYSGGDTSSAEGKQVVLKKIQNLSLENRKAFNNSEKQLANIELSPRVQNLLKLIYEDEKASGRTIEEFRINLYYSFEKDSCTISLGITGHKKSGEVVGDHSQYASENPKVRPSMYGGGFVNLCSDVGLQDKLIANLENIVSGRLKSNSDYRKQDKDSPVPNLDDYSEAKKSNRRGTKSVPAAPAAPSHEIAPSKTGGAT